MRLVEGAGQIGTRVGQGEAVAATQMVLRQAPHRHAVPCLAVHGNEPQVIELARRLEQNTGLVRRLASRRLHRPRGVAQGEIDVGRVRSLVAAPGADVAREGKLARKPGKGLAEFRFQLASQRRAVKARRRFGLVAVQGLALDDLALAGKQRRQFMLRCLQRREFGLDAEELAEEILDMRCQREQELRFLPAPEGVLIDPRRGEPGAESRVGSGKLGAEGGVDAGESRSRIQIGKRQSEFELQHPAGPGFSARMSGSLQRKRRVETRIEGVKVKASRANTRGCRTAIRARRNGADCRSRRVKKGVFYLPGTRQGIPVAA